MKLVSAPARMRVFYAVVRLVLFAGVGAFAAASSVAASETTVSALARETHFHGLAVDPASAGHLLLATHHGVFRVAPDGTARPVSATRDDFMGFTADPVDPSTLYASGHPAGGGNLGFITSRDGGRSWRKRSDGANGPVDFHQMDVSKANPKVVYGVYGAIQRSDDAGKTWRITGEAPKGLIDFGASAVDADVVYAATKDGLQKSADAGRTWQSIQLLRAPTTMIHVSPIGNIYAFILGSGLVRASERDLRWQPLESEFGAQAIIHLAIAPTDPETLYAAARDLNSREQHLMMSRDGGANWQRIGEP